MQPHNPQHTGVREKPSCKLFTHNPDPEHSAPAAVEAQAPGQSPERELSWSQCRDELRHSSAAPVSTAPSQGPPQLRGSTPCQCHPVPGAPIPTPCWPEEQPHGPRVTGQAHKAALTALQTSLEIASALPLSPDRPRPAGISQIQGSGMFSRSVKASETRASSQVTFCSCHGTSGIFQQLHFLQMPLAAALRAIPVTQ